jgi:hypothetical protein
MDYIVLVGRSLCLFVLSDAILACTFCSSSFYLPVEILVLQDCCSTRAMHTSSPKHVLKMLCTVRTIAVVDSNFAFLGCLSGGITRYGVLCTFISKRGMTHIHTYGVLFHAMYLPTYLPTYLGTKLVIRPKNPCIACQKDKDFCHKMQAVGRGRQAGLIY